MRKKILITGINGFLGSHLAKKLIKDYDIIGLEYTTDNLYRIASENFKVYSSLEHSLRNIFEEHDFFAVIHAATVYNRNGESLLNLLKTNINLPTRLLELANQHNVKLFVNTDSFFNDSNSLYSYLPYYTLSKKHSLEWIKLYSKDSFSKVVNMKIFHMYGENDAPEKFVPSITKKILNNVESIDFTNGTQTRDFIYIDDVVSAYEYVLKSFSFLENFQQYDIATGKSISIKEFVTLVKNISNSNTKLNFGKFPYRDGEIMESEAKDFSLNKLGWSPKYITEIGIKKYIKLI